ASSNDGLTRRDRGLEFLEVTGHLEVSVRSVEKDAANQVQTQHLVLTNISSETVDTHLLLCFTRLTAGVTVLDAEGLTRSGPVAGVPYLRVFLPEGVLEPGEVLEVVVRFGAAASTEVEYTVALLSGQGKP